MVVFTLLVGVEADRISMDNNLTRLVKWIKDEYTLIHSSTSAHSSCVSQFSVSVTKTWDNQLTKKKGSLYSGFRGFSPWPLLALLLYASAWAHVMSTWWKKPDHLMPVRKQRERKSRVCVPSIFSKSTLSII
jgi:hypothetical protein